MSISLHSLAQLLETQGIKGANLSELPIDMTTLSALAFDIDPVDTLPTWQTLRALIHETARYPVVVCNWGGPRDFFSRWWYEGETQAGVSVDIAPEAILEAVPQADMHGFLTNRERATSDRLAEEIHWRLQQTQQRFDACPEEREIARLIEKKNIQSVVDLEHWLFNWERHTFGDALALLADDTSYIDWFVPDPPAIVLLLPISKSWSTLAYLHWYGALECGTPMAIRFLQHWQEQYGAELVCHYGTMLQFEVQRIPATPDEAFQLAWEQEALADCTTSLPGVSLRDHARTLLGVKRWFLHQRP